MTKFNFKNALKNCVLGAILSFSALAFSACSSKSTVLKIMFSPYADSDTIIAKTAPMENLIKDEMKKRGFDIKKVELTVGTSYEAVGEALASGKVDAGFISGGTYVLFDKECDVLLTALRSAINKDSLNPKDWNDGTIEKELPSFAKGYRCIILAGPSPLGKKLQKKIENGENLTWEELNDARWAIMSPASASGYQYPSLWLKNNFGHSFSELKNPVRSDSYTTSVARLASRQVDIMVSYGHIRIKNAPLWKSKFGAENEMQEDTGIIGVTPMIFNDTVSVSKKSSLMKNEKFREAFAESMIELGKTAEGKEILKTFSQKGFEKGNSEDYNDEREVQKLLINN